MFVKHTEQLHGHKFDFEYFDLPLKISSAWACCTRAYVLYECYHLSLGGTHTNDLLLLSKIQAEPMQ